jgi:hypothetical protein
VLLWRPGQNRVGTQTRTEPALHFKEREHTQLGEHSFESTVADVARLETALGIADLARFMAP